MGVESLSTRDPEQVGPPIAPCTRGAQAIGDGFTNELESAERRRGFRTRDLAEDVSEGPKRLNLGATPSRGTLVSGIDLDLTLDCNLRCTYCFKEKSNEQMGEQVAFDAIVWLLYASGPAKALRVNFLGGEPILRFPLIENLVPFAKRRASQIGKSIHFGVTTNCTLVTDEVVDFFRKWGMGFHTSIDGTPEIQDRNRPTADGRGSSRFVERSLPKILGYRPNTTARSTVMPESAGLLLDSYRYFRSLGYINIAFVPAGSVPWSADAIALYEDQFLRLGEILVDEFRNNRLIIVKGINEALEGLVRKQPPRHACGAGRGMVLIDVHGDIWPCHRWNRESEGAWRIGSIYQEFDELARANLDRPCQTDLLQEDCGACEARPFCGGGCPAENLEVSGSIYKRPPSSCELTRVWARVGKKIHDILCCEENALFLKHYYKRDEAAA